MALLYSDEDFSHRVVATLLALGHDVLTVHDVGRGGQGIPDPDVFADAQSRGRTILTFNHRHLARLARTQTSHFGIISCTRDDDVDALAYRIDAAITTGGALKNQFIRVVKPHKP